MAILRIEDLSKIELEKILKDKIKSLRELEMKIENLYNRGAYDYADYLDMIASIEIDDIIEIEKLLGVNHEQ